MALASLLLAPAAPSSSLHESLPPRSLLPSPASASSSSASASRSVAANLRRTIVSTPSSYSPSRSGSSIRPRPAMEASDPSPTGDAPSISVLFVCWGNICRSPTAEAVFRHAVEKRGLDDRFNIDSAGTISYHEGEPADARMKAAALKRGIKLTSISRPIRPSDFHDFDIILAMDNKNRADIMKAHREWSTMQAVPPYSEEKVKMMCEYCRKHEETEVPDPYYGGPAGFEKVLDLLEDACDALLDSLVPLGSKTSD